MRWALNPHSRSAGRREGSDVPRPARPQATGRDEVELPHQRGLRLTSVSSAPDSTELTRAILSGGEGDAAEVAVVLGDGL